MMVNDELRLDQLENYALIERIFETPPRSGGDILLKMEKNVISNRNVNKNLTDALNIGYYYKIGPYNGARTVWVRIVYEGIGEVDTMNEKFNANVRIKCKWYHPDNEEFDTYDPKKHWYPKLYIENALENVKEDLYYKITRLDNGKRLITETRVAKGSFWERIELQDFPIDVQELSVTVASRFNCSLVKLVGDPLKPSNLHSETLHTFRDQQKFQLYTIVTTSEQASYDTDTPLKQVSVSSDMHSGAKRSDSKAHEIDTSLYTKPSKRSKYVATTYCSRRPGYFLMNVYAFNFLITSLSLVIFSIDTDKAPNRITGTFTLILTSVSFKFVSNRSVPTVSYMTSLDRYQIILIMFLCSCCLWHAIISGILTKSEQLILKVFVDKMALCIFAVVFFVIQFTFSIIIYLSYLKIKKLESQEKQYLRLGNENDADSDDEQF